MKKLLLAATAATLVGLGAAAPAGAAEIRYASAGDIYGLDPHSMTDSFSINFLQHIYEPLVRYNKELKIEAALAERWEAIKPDVVRYHLRQGVKFHDGADFTADDVVASLKRATHEKSPIKGNLPALKDVVKVDDHTVDLVLTGPTPLLNNFLTNMSIFDAGWLEANDAVEPVNAQQGEEGYSTRNANGTGPFKVESRRPDAQTVLVANEAWWDEPQHNLTKIIHTPIGSDATRVAALLSGEIDVVVPSPLQDAARIANSPGVQVLEAPGLRSIMLGFNMKEKLNDGDVDGNPFQDPAVRKAVYQAINMDLIRDRIMRGKSRNGGALVAPEVPGFDEAVNERFPYDVEAAKAALAEAGYPEGFQFNLNCPNDAYVNDEEICQAIAAMLAQAGLRPKLVTEARTLHFQKALAGQADMFMLGWATLPMLDGYSVLSAMLHSPEDKLGTWNPGGYVNARIDEITKQVNVELDEEKRRALMVEAFEIAKAEVAWLPLHQQPLSWATRDNVHVEQTADDLLRLWYARVD